MKKIKDYSLYLIITEEYGLGRSALEIAKCAIAGGIDMIQMREKKNGEKEIVELGRSLAELCRHRNIPFIVNDNPLLAKKIDADGVHLGQEDILKNTIAKTRGIVGENKIIGVSTHSLSQFKRADEEDVDYTAFGPIFYTETKNYFIGTKDVKKVLEIAKKPVFFIGGINLANIEELLKIGAKNISMIRGITQAEDIEKTTEAFKNRMSAQKGEQNG